MDREMNAEKAANDMKRVAEEVKKIDDVQAAFLAGHVRGMMDAIKMKSRETAQAAFLAGHVRGMMDAIKMKSRETAQAEG